MLFLFIGYIETEYIILLGSTIVLTSPRKTYGWGPRMYHLVQTAGKVGILSIRIQSRIMQASPKCVFMMKFPLMGHLETEYIIILE